MRIIIEIDETSAGKKTTVITPSTDNNQNDALSSQTSSVENVGAGPSVENVESENELNSNKQSQTSLGIMDAGVAPETDV